MDKQIREQVISKCLSHNNHRKLLEKWKTLTLQQLREIACIMEDSEKQACKFEGAANEVKRVSVNSNKKKQKTKVAGKQGTVRCFCCGNVGQKANMIKVAPQEENSAESVIIQAISRECAKLNQRHQMGGGK